MRPDLYTGARIKREAVVRSRLGLTLIASLTLLAGGGGAALAVPAGPGSVPSAQAQGGAAIARAVNLRALAAGPQRPVRAWTGGPLGRDGRPAGAGLPVLPSRGAKTAPPPAKPIAGGPNSGKAPRLRVQPIPLAPPTTINANFSGIHQSNSNCGCQPPDTNAAVGLTQIVETVNLRLEVYSKTGVAQCGIGLNTFLGTSSSLSDPRVQYDNLNNRFSMVVTVVPTSGATPALYVLASQTSSACGSWWIYHITFFGSFYPNGTLLDYPYLGQDRVSVLFSS